MSPVKREVAAGGAGDDEEEEKAPPLPPPVPLDVSDADRSVWLVKVPGFVAERWREACAGAAAATAAGGAPGPELGRFVVPAKRGGNGGGNKDDDVDVDDDKPSTSTTSTFPTLLRLTGSGARPGAPTAFTIRGDAAEARGNPPARVFAVSADGSCESGGEGAVAASAGRVSARLDAIVAPAAAGAAASAGESSSFASYGALARERAAIAKAEQDARKMLRLTEGVPRTTATAATATTAVPSSAVTAVGGVTSALALKRAAAAALAAAPASSKRRPKRGEWEHRARASRDDVEAALFRCFERQRHWTFAALHSELDQPAPWLKEVLEGVAVLNKRGPLKGQWEQKKDFG